VRDGAGDRLRRARVGVLRGRSLAAEMAVQELGHAVRAAEQDPALPVDVRHVLRAHGGGEAVRCADADRPTKRLVHASPGVIVLDRKRSVDARSVHLLTLDVEPAHGRPHPLGSDHRDVHVRREGVALIV